MADEGVSNHQPARTPDLSSAHTAVWKMRGARRAGGRGSSGDR